MVRDSKFFVRQVVCALTNTPIIVSEGITIAFQVLACLERKISSRANIGHPKYKAINA